LHYVFYFGDFEQNSPTENAEFGCKITDEKYITSSAFLFGDFLHFYFGGDKKVNPSLNPQVFYLKKA